VAVERLDRTTELGSGLRGGLEPVRWRGARLARGFGGLRGVGNRSGTVFARNDFLDLAVQRLRCFPLAPKDLEQRGFELSTRTGDTRFQILCYGGLGHVPPPSTALHRSSPGLQAPNGDRGALFVGQLACFCKRSVVRVQKRRSQEA